MSIKNGREEFVQHIKTTEEYKQPSPKKFQYILELQYYKVPKTLEIKRGKKNKKGNK